MFLYVIRLRCLVSTTIKDPHSAYPVATLKFGDRMDVFLRDPDQVQALLDAIEERIETFLFRDMLTDEPIQLEPDHFDVVSVGGRMGGRALQVAEA